jgi:hypothetical protein
MFVGDVGVVGVGVVSPDGVAVLARCHAERVGKLDTLYITIDRRNVANLHANRLP